MKRILSAVLLGAFGLAVCCGCNDKNVTPTKQLEPSKPDLAAPPPPKLPMPK